MTVTEAVAGEETATAVANGLKLNGGTITGSSGEPAGLAFGTAPGIVEVSIGEEPSGDGRWRAGEDVEVLVRFAEPVDVGTAEGTPSLQATIGTATKTLTYASGTGTDTLVFSYRMQSEDAAAETVLVSTNALTLNEGTIRSTGGLDAGIEHNGAAGMAIARPTLPVVSVSAAQAAEGEALVFDVTLSQASTTAVTVDYATADGTGENGAVEPGDYTDTSGTLTFDAGETAKQVSVPTAEDEADEGSETMKLVLSNPSGATIGAGEAEGTITNVAASNEPEPLIVDAITGPPEHAGNGDTFTAKLTFSENPRMSWRTIGAKLMTVTGGTLDKVKRAAKGSSKEWNLTITPAGDTAVVIATSPSQLGACGAEHQICTEDGRTLMGTESKDIPGPLSVSIGDANVREGPGATLEFQVTLSRKRHAQVSVDYATNGGTATVNEDYRGTGGTLVFEADETVKTIAVEVLEDAHNDDGETVIVQLSNPVPAAYVRLGNAEGVGTIENSDPMPKAWNLRFARQIGGFLVDALGARLDDSGQSRMSVGGIPLMGAMPGEPETEEEDPFGLPAWAQGAREEDMGSMSARDLLLGSSFHLSSRGEDAAGGPAFTAWGQVGTGGFEAEEDDVTLEGDVTSGIVGFDAEWERGLAGIMLSQSRGTGSYRLAPEVGTSAGEVESDMTGIYPYASMRLNERVSAWVLAGTGSGELTLKPEKGKAMPTDISMRMGAIGIKGKVLAPESGAGLTLNVKSDAMWVGSKSERTDELVATEGDVTRLRLTLQGERQFTSGTGATFTPKAELGLRHDGGDAETGTGVEIGAGVSYSAGTLTMEGQIRGLVAHEESGHEEWGASGAIRVSPGASGRGLTVSITPQWGHTASATDRLWAARDASELGQESDHEPGGQIAMDAGYGFALGPARGVLTPYAGLSLGEEASRTVRAGARWQIGPDFALGLEATRNESTGGDAGSALRLQGALRF